MPGVDHAAFTPAQAEPRATVTITYAGHSTYVIETPAGVRIATDFSGVYGADPLPRVVTMNKAHRTHYTDFPDPASNMCCAAGTARAARPGTRSRSTTSTSATCRPTSAAAAAMEADGNSIFIFEVAGLCIGHLGHLHHQLEDAHYAAIGRLDIVMVPIDGGMTQSLADMRRSPTACIRRSSCRCTAMPRRSANSPAMMGEAFAVEFRGGRSLLGELRDLPRRPTIIVLDGV